MKYYGKLVWNINIQEQNVLKIQRQTQLSTLS